MKNNKTSRRKYQRKSSDPRARQRNHTGDNKSTTDTTKQNQ